MLWNVETLGFLLAVTLGLSIQCLVHVSSSPAPCRGCHPDSQGKTKAKIRQMEKEAKELFRAYVIHQGLCPHSLQQACYNAIPWLPGKSATDQTWVAWLQELHHTLEHMQEALKTMEKQQETLSTPGSALHERLQHAQRSVRGLLSNTNCTLCLEGASPKPSPTPDRCEATSTFQQKLDGCSVLWNYSQFLAARARGSGRKARWANRVQQKRQKATKRKAATSRSFVRCPAKTGQP